MEKIGIGKYSTVHKVLEIKTMKSYAVKIILKENLTDEETEVL